MDKTVSLNDKKVGSDLCADREYLQKPHPMMLIHEVCRLMGDKLRAKGDGHPVEQRSGRLLMMELSRKEGRTQLDLVKATHLKAPTISVALQKLEADGYVMRKPDENDLRALRVYLTDKERALEDGLKKRIEEEENAAARVLTEEECEILCSLLMKIRSNLLSGTDESNSADE